MKIITWNCNGALRNKIKYIIDLNADICIIQECENPTESKDKNYRNWASNYLWKGDSKNKGIGVFANTNIKLQELNWSDCFENQRVKHFLPCKINNKFDLLAVWTHQNNSYKYGYIGQLWKYLQLNKELVRDSIIIGDFNSNAIWDKSKRWWNHSDVINELAEIGLKSLYHEVSKEKQGNESKPTFYLQKNIKKPYHIDYIFSNNEFYEKLIELKIGEISKWLKVSDHLPIICEFKD